MNFTHGGNVFAIARARDLAPEDILDFSASINPLGPAPGVREAVAAAFDRIGHYPDSDCAELRLALARLHGVAPANICVANGSTELIYLLPRLVTGRRALVVAPPFSEYAAALARDGWEVDYLVLSPETRFDLSPERFEVQLRQRYDLAIVGNPGNPTGRLYDRETVAALARSCREAGCFLVVDEAFMDFCEEASTKVLAVRDEAVLVLRSLTKFYALPGLRLGYAIGSVPVIDRLSRLREPWSVNTLAQAAGLASLATDDYATATRALIAAERHRLMAGLAAINGLRPFPSVANYLLVEATDGPSAGELAERLLAERILIRDCGNFRGLNDRFLRVAVRSPAENGRLLTALAAATG
ncbi:MAG TPA: threonine-phosphate decarboxylase CobD [Geobacteraceae bacterium]